MEDKHVYNMKEWQHIFKLDPAKEIGDEDLEKICESGTDAIIVGGTDNVTLDGVLDLLARIRRHTVPVILEISTIDALTPGYDFYYVPMVMNSKDKQWIMGLHHEAVKAYRDMMHWDEIMMEGYCVINPEAKVFTHTQCELPTEEDTVAYAYMAEHMYKLPIFYLENSGAYADPALVSKVKNQLSNTLLFYGGGIASPEQAAEMKQYADVIIVGNSVYDNIKAALKTVAAVKGKK